MTPTQQAITDLRAEGKGVWERASMVEMHEWCAAMSAAELAAWDCSECCGNRYGDRCASGRVQRARAAKLQANGMGRDSVRSMTEICEHSESYADIATAWRLAKDMAPDGVRLAEVVSAVQAVERDLDGDGND